MVAVLGLLGAMLGFYIFDRDTGKVKLDQEEIAILLSSFILGALFVLYIYHWTPSFIHSIVYKTSEVSFAEISYFIILSILYFFGVGKIYLSCLRINEALLRNIFIMLLLIVMPYLSQFMDYLFGIKAKDDSFLYILYISIIFVGLLGSSGKKY